MRKPFVRNDDLLHQDCREAIYDLTDALRFTVEYVGFETLPPIPGWSWYDAMRKYSPHICTLMSQGGVKKLADISSVRVEPKGTPYTSSNSMGEVYIPTQAEWNANYEKNKAFLISQEVAEGGIYTDTVSEWQRKQKLRQDFKEAMVPPEPELDRSIPWDQTGLSPLAHISEYGLGNERIEDLLKAQHYIKKRLEDF